MSIDERKIELAKRILSVKNEELLSQLEHLLSSKYPEPSEALFSALSEAETSYVKGEYFSQAEVMEKMKEKFPNLF